VRGHQRGAVAAIGPDLPLRGGPLKGASGMPGLSQNFWFPHPHEGPTPVALLFFPAIAHDPTAENAKTPPGDREIAHPPDRPIQLRVDLEAGRMAGLYSLPQIRERQPHLHGILEQQACSVLPVLGTVKGRGPSRGQDSGFPSRQPGPRGSGPPPHVGHSRSCQPPSLDDDGGHCRR